MSENKLSGWSVLNLEECVDILDGKRIPINANEREKRINGKSQLSLIPYYGATGQVGWIDDYIFDEELVLLGEDGAPFLDGFKNKAYIIQGRTWVNNHAHVLRVKNEVILNHLLKYYLDIVDYHDYVTGTTRLKLNQSRMRKIPIKIPPLTEQERIVAKIEELFTQLDAGVAELRKAKAQLKRYRQAVLKAAVTGELTREWRERRQDGAGAGVGAGLLSLDGSEPSPGTSNPKPDPETTETCPYEGRSYESGGALLRRILKERREKWQAEGGKGKYVEPAAPDTESLPELPDGWVWASIEQISDPIKKVTYGILKPGLYIRDGIPMLRILDIKNGIVDLSDVHRVSPELSGQYHRTLLEGGECLISLVGSIGLTAHVPISISGVNVHRNLGVIRTIPSIDSKYLNIALSSTLLQKQIRQFTTGANQPLFNLGELKRLVLSVPHFREQQRIVEMAERRLSVADEIEKEIDQALVKAERLRQSILKRAFEGRLVEQRPEDGSAEELLERIRAERNPKAQQLKMGISD